MFKKVKDWLSKKVGDKALVDERDHWFGEALKFENKAITYSDAMVALNEKHLNNIAALYNIISAIILREENCELTLSQDMLLAAQQAPEVQLANNEDGALIVRFLDPKTHDLVEQ